MNLKKIFSPILKDNLALFLVIVFGIILIKSYASHNNLETSAAPFNLTATITAEKTELCEREFMDITFEGLAGTAPYIFSYTIDNGAVQTITSDNSGIAILNFREVFGGTFTYKLTSVQDANSQVAQVDDQEVSILVNPLPTVSFTFDKNNVCAGELITFTPQVSGAGDFQYKWTFEDGVISYLESPSHSVEALGCSTEDRVFRVTLEVTDKNGCLNSVVNFVTVTPKPDLEFFDADIGSDVVLEDFNNCDNASIANPQFTVNVGNKSKSPCVDSYSVDWGDGNTEDSITFPIAHTYSELGIYTMKVRGLGENGCFSELSYQVINITNPVGELTSIEATNNVCLSDAELDFEITNFQTNWIDTTYSIDFGDGSPIESYTHSEILNSNKLTHVYEKGSCDEPNGEFVATLSIENICSKIERTLNNIKILKPSKSEFEAQDIACINSNVEFINKSFIGENDDCNKAADFTWDFGDGTIITDSATGQLTNQIHQYNSSGTFTVTLSVTTQCGTDIFTKEICIEEVNTPTFVLDNDTGCIPLNVSATNTTVENTVCSTASYNWEVSYAAGNCDTSGSWSFVNGTDKNSENPEFLFSNPGFYTLTQNIITGCGTETNSKVIEVKKPPTVTIDAIDNSCDNLTLNPVANIENCTSDNSGMIYNWTFIGGTPESANTLNPGNIVYNSPGTYEVTLEITNECGISNLATQPFEVLEKPIITNTNLTQEICSNQSTTPIELTSNLENTTYTWSAVASDGISGFISNGVTSTIPSQTIINSQDTSGKVTYSITPSRNGCNGVPVEFVVNVNSTPRISAHPVSATLCNNTASWNTPALKVSFENGSGIASYQWFVNTIDSNLGGDLITDATNSSYIPPTNNFGELFYYAEISFSSGGCNKIVSNTAAINVVGVQFPSDIDYGPKTYCVGENSNPIEVVIPEQKGIEFIYQWYSNTSDDKFSGDKIAIDGATTNSYTPPTITAGEKYYFVEITSDVCATNSVISESFQVIVNETPIISPSKISIHSGETFTFNPKSIVENTIPENTSYTWDMPSFNPSDAITGASATATPIQIISQSLENTTNSPVKVNYIINPATESCTGNPFTLEVTVYASINSNAVIVPNSCFNANDAYIITNISGGVPFENGNPYKISWTGPNGFSSTDPSITNLEIGIYTITIEDKDGVTKTEEFTITEPNLLEITKDIEKNISCFNGNDGTIEVTINGGTLPYSYNWTTNNGDGIIPNSQNQNTLTKGNYTLEVIDKNGCRTSTNFEITEPLELQIDLLNKNDILCFGDALGAIEIDVSGGTKKEISSGVLDYEYSWTGPNGYESNSKSLNNLVAGIYTINVNDDLGCSTSASFTVNQLDQINIEVVKTDESCYQKNDGTINVTLSGGTAPYTYSWSNSVDSLSLSDLAPDTYTITVTDANNCTEQLSIVINDAIFFIEPTTVPMTCNSQNDASINLNLTGGIEPISIVWSDGVTGLSQRSNLAAGTYTVTITDSNPTQCPIEETFIITNPTPIIVTETVIDAIDCDNENSGSINLDISGGKAPYTFLWNTNETSEDLEKIGPGEYSVQITDALGCVIEKEFNIFRQDLLDIDLDEIIVKNCDLQTASKQITATGKGGFPPYTYSWSSGTISGLENNIMTTEVSSNYIITVTDQKGCTSIKSIDLNVPEIGIQDFTYDSFALGNYDLLSIMDPIQFSNLSTGDFTKITWDFGDGSDISNEENPLHTYDKIGIYTIKYAIEYEAGCTYILEKEVNITKGYILINPNSFTPNGDGFNDTIRPIHKGFSEIEITIYNTWGTIVYYEKNINLIGWDGSLKGLPAENGNYVMVVKGQTLYKGEIIETAPFTLIK